MRFIKCDDCQCEVRTYNYFKLSATQLPHCDNCVKGYSESAKSILTRVHRLDTLPGFFEEVLSGRKNFEIRRNDRSFEIGDVLELAERAYSPMHYGRKRDVDYTGRLIVTEPVTYILHDFDGLGIGYAILSFPKLDTVSSQRRSHVEL